MAIYKIYFKNNETGAIVVSVENYSEKIAKKYQRIIQRDLKRRGHDHISVHIRKF